MCLLGFVPRRTRLDFSESPSPSDVTPPAAAMRNPRARKTPPPENGDNGATVSKPVKGPDMSRVDFTKKLSDVKLNRDVLFVPPSMPATDLLVKMQSTRIHMAVVVDEYGGTDGLVTIEDLVEEIVGDIEDEHDTSGGPLIVDTEQGYDVDARVSIEEFEEKLHFEIHGDDGDEDIDTIGGLVVSLVGRVPGRGELVRHESGIEFEVLEGDPRRLKKLRVHLASSRPARQARNARDDKPAQSQEEPKAQGSDTRQGSGADEKAPPVNS